LAVTYCEYVCAVEVLVMAARAALAALRVSRAAVSFNRASTSPLCTLSPVCTEIVATVPEVVKVRDRASALWTEPDADTDAMTVPRSTVLVADAEALAVPPLLSDTYP
jgi:hypothetical protein